MAEALIEAAPGATRALVMDGDTVLEAHLERPDLGARAGARLPARLVRLLVPGVRGIARLEDGQELLLAPLPTAATEGAQLGIEVTRTALPEAGRPRLARARALPDVPEAADSGPDLAARLVAAGHRLHAISGPQDRLEAAGWSAVVAEAESGLISFGAGLLTISLTPAMTVIDIDGEAAPEPLALAAVPALVAAIRRLDLQGGIVVDFPSLAGPARKRLDAALLAALGAALPEAPMLTTINGFGLVQIVRPRTRPSLMEAARTPGFNALELLRKAARQGHGAATLVAPPVMTGWLAARPALLAEAAAARGGPLGLRTAEGLARSEAYVGP